MQYETWVRWLEDNKDGDEATKLAALRKYIVETAYTWVANGEITAAWANKKLAKLGIVERVAVDSTYTLDAAVTSASLTMSIRAASRAEALGKFQARLAAAGGLTVIDVVADAPVFTNGPEDPTADGMPDGPATVADTLTMLREIILLGNIAGPCFNCDSGSNRVLASFGLDPVPERKKFTIATPVEAVMKTTVEAYDEASATRVAHWRTEDGWKRTDVDHATVTGPVTVVALNS